MPELYFPKASEWIDAYQAGDQQRQQREQRVGAQRIGGLVSSGDYGGAAAAAYGMGDYNAGSRLQEYGDRQKKVAERKTVLGQMQGDPAKAQEAAFASGDTDLIKTVTDWRDRVSAEEATKAAKESEDAGRIILGAMSLPPEQRPAFFQSHGKDPAAMGSDFSDSAMEASLAQFQTVADTLKQRDVKADNVRADKQLQATVDHNKASERTANGQLAVAQGNLRVRQSEAARAAASSASGPSRPPTAAQSQAVAYAYRAQQANRRMTQLVDRGVVKPRTATAQLFEADKNGVVRMVTKSPEDRQFIQTAKEWLAPILRKDTGAAVTDSELSTYMDIYIPRFEDDAQTIRQKAAARKDAMIAINGETGGHYESMYGQPQFNVSFVAPIKNRPPISKFFGK